MTKPSDHHLVTSTHVHAGVRAREAREENVIVGRLIPAGTGLAYHNIRKAQAAEPPLIETPPAVEEAPAAEATAGGS